MKEKLQRVKLSPRIFSNWEPVSAGIPQETKLGLWLFLLMINDLAISNDQFDGDMTKYVNDTNVSEYIVEIHIEEISSSLINQNVKRLLCLLKGITKPPYQKYKWITD